MRSFKHPNTNGSWVCPICKTNDDKPVVLIGIVGTQDGGNIQAEQFHLDCIELHYDREYHILYQRTE